MNGHYHLKKVTEHALYDVEMSVHMSQSDTFELVMNEIEGIADWSRYRAATEEGIREAIESYGQPPSRKFVVQVAELSGQTPPFGFKACAREAVRSALASGFENGT